MPWGSVFRSLFTGRGHQQQGEGHHGPMAGGASSSSSPQQQQQQHGYPPAQVYSVGGVRQPPSQPGPRPGSSWAGHGAPPNAYVPYPPMPQPRTHEYQPTATIHNPVNLHKSTLRLEPVSGSTQLLSIAFTFDASTACRVTTFVHAREDSKRNCKISVSVGSPAPAVYYDKGLEQHFPREPPSAKQPAAQLHAVDLGRHYLADLCSHTPSPPASTDNTYPIIIRLEALTQEGQGEGRSLSGLQPGCELPYWVQSQSTYAKLVKEEDGRVGIRVLEQKIWVRGEAYELQEIYGMEQNRGGAAGGGAAGAGGLGTSGAEDGGEGSECVVCLSAPRNTAAMPCRHMCMCKSCASELKSQTNKCPICRMEIQSLLAIVGRRGRA